MPSPQIKDRRGYKLRSDIIQRWYVLPSGFKVGLNYTNEFRMGADAGQVLIANKEGSEWINFGEYQFYFPGWNAGGVQPENWNNPISHTSDGNYLVLNWLYAHRHSTISPALIHIPTQTYLLVEPRRLLTATGVTILDDRPVLSCSELVWQDSRSSDHSNVQIPISTALQPITEFYELDPFKIETDVYSWKEGVLSIEPLQNFHAKLPTNEKAREEIKRDRAYSPIQRWHHVKAFINWVNRRP